MKTLRLFIVMALVLPCRAIASDADSSAKTYYYAAKQRLEDMLAGKAPLSYEEAIYQVENAWWEGAVSYCSYKRSLDYHTGNIRSLMENCRDGMSRPGELLQTAEQKQELYKKALANYAIFSYLTKPAIFLNEEEMAIHKPYGYSSADPLGTNDWRNTQVTHLINEHTGNCFALASLFRIFSERLASDAKLCTAPGHIYIRHADDKGVYFNVELASRSFPGTGTIETLTYTSDEAAKNGIVSRELNIKESVALCLVYLAKGYEKKFPDREDSFILDCAEIALRYDRNNLNAMLLKAEVLENRLLNLGNDVAALKGSKEFGIYQDWMTKLYQTGYREMPFEMKNRLLNGVRKDAETVLAGANHIPDRFSNPNLNGSRYAGLSWGLFDEEIRAKRLERYGRTILNVKAGKIVAFVEEDVLLNNYDFDPVIFAWNIDPLAHKFPFQSPYSAFGNNPIYYIDVGGAFQYPADQAANYSKDYPMLTTYLAMNVQHDIKKSPIVQNAVTKNTYGSYSKQDLIWKVAAWGDERSPTIKFVEGLTERNGSSVAFTPNSKEIQIDAGYAKAIDAILGSSEFSTEDKQAAITKFYETLLDETTLTGYKTGFGKPDVGDAGNDAKMEIFHIKKVKTDTGETVEVNEYGGDVDAGHSELTGTKRMIERKKQEGNTEVLPTIPTKP
jgi:hypothetical protein